jgi:CPA1 family monovalent cation:H+ antiporter
VLESLTFIIVGLDLPDVARALGEYPLGRLLAHAAAVTAVVIGLRMAWVWPSSYGSRWLGRTLLHDDRPYPPWRWVLFVGWAGMRGGDSLVLALALPFTAQGGAPFPAREQIIFITFSVIFATLVVKGLTLGPLIRLLGLREEPFVAEEAAHARRVAVEAALARLDEMAAKHALRPEVVRYLRRRALQRARRWSAVERRRFHRAHHHRGEERYLQVAGAHEGGALDERRVAEYRTLRSEMLDAERRAVIALRDEGEISDDVMRDVQHDLDLEELLLESSEPVAPRPGEAEMS